MLTKPNLVLILSALIILGCQKDQSTSEELDKISAQFELIGLSTALIQDGKVKVLYSGGTSNIATNSPNTDSTYYRIASISKMFTSMAVMKLWQQGNVDLDTPASDLLGWTLVNPNQPDSTITLRHLMDHTSGIRDGKGYGALISAMRDSTQNIRELFQESGKFYTSDMFDERSPGQFFSYTNCTWGLIATIVESLSGKRFDQFCKDELFIPMGLGASFNVDDIPSDQLAALYRFKEGQWVPQADDVSQGTLPSFLKDDYTIGTNGLVFGPQGSLRISLKDLIAVAQMLINNGTYEGTPILEKKTLDYFLSDPWEYQKENGDTWGSFWHSYTKGIHLITNTPGADVIFSDRKMFGHPGIAYGLLSDLYVDQGTKTAVIFITNGSKQAFEYAENTSFYAVEDAVFQVYRSLIEE